MDWRDSPGYFLAVVVAVLLSAFVLALRQSTIRDSGVCHVPPATFAAPTAPIAPGPGP